MRVFLDTNVLASALATRGLCADLLEAVLQSHELLICEPVLEELKRVLPGKLGLTERITSEFMSLIGSHATKVEPVDNLSDLPDPDNAMIIATAFEGSAEVFVTGGKALLKLKTIEGRPVISPREWWEMLTKLGN